MAHQDDIRRIPALLGLVLGSSPIACNVILGIDEFDTNGCPAAGISQCVDDWVETCSADGSWSKAAEKCGAGCFDGKCAICSEGVKICTTVTNLETNTIIKTATGECFRGQWHEKTCNNQTCVDGECIGVCAPSRRCADSYTAQDCQGGFWKNVEECKAGSLCVNGECYP